MIGWCLFLSEISLCERYLQHLKIKLNYSHLLCQSFYDERIFFLFILPLRRSAFRRIGQTLRRRSSQTNPCFVKHKRRNSWISIFVSSYLSCTGNRLCQSQPVYDGASSSYFLLFYFKQIRISCIFLFFSIFSISCS